MRNAIVLHGTCDSEEYYSAEYPSASNSHWIPWLQKQLLINDIYTITPEMFQSFDPIYDLRKKEFEKNDISNQTLLVGHSCGGGFLIRWISENSNRYVGKIILVAPWLDPNQTKGNRFFDFEIDSDLVSRTQGVIIFSSSNDDDDIKESINMLAFSIQNIVIKEFKNYGHFCQSDMGTEKFSELLEECLKK